MSEKKKRKDQIVYSKFLGSTFGHIAFASFIIAVVTGILLAVFYDISKPYDSIALMLITNPSAMVIRSLHYWSAQFFMIFILFHIWDHLRKSTETRVKKGVWLRLVISILAILFVMLSGFILKGDADSLQAKRILTTLLAEIPLLGKYIAYSLLGKEDGFQLVYVHHIATVTIFIFIVIFEHVKLVWPQIKVVLYFSLISLFFSLFFPASLHDNLNPVMKGPWYFLGMQELFHYLSSPGIVLIFLTAFFTLINLVHRFTSSISNKIKILILSIVLLYSILTIIGYFFRGENWELMYPWNNSYFTNTNYDPITNAKTHFTDFDTSKEIPVIQGRREGCLYCHNDMKGFADAHSPEAIGCASCHLGNTFTIDQTLAHSGMISIPGNLETANLSCGSSNCHPGIPDQVQKSLMNTMSGVVSVNRFVFKESDDLDELNDIRYIGSSAADTHLRNLCASCHIGKEKTEFGPITQLSRGGGCNACHLNFSDDAKNDLEKLSISQTDSSIIKFHPSLDLNITNDHCFGCHSRSGRISTNYEGWHETQLEGNEMPSDSLFRLLDDERVFQFVSDDIHHQRGLECIDCHNSYEIMGDGNIYAHQEEQTKVMCEDCHFSHTPNYIENKDLDTESKKIVELRNLDQRQHKYLFTRKDSIPLINTFVDDDTIYMVGKNSKKNFELKPPNFICEESEAHDRLTCNSCHTAWAPQCVGCHTEFNSGAKGVDHLTEKETNGEWIEWMGDFLAEAPTLGILKDRFGNEKIETFIPGMVMTLDKSKFDPTDNQTIFHRLFAPTVAHTISAKGRSCKSCHNDPLAIGYGRGNLTYTSSGLWMFTPMFAEDSTDGLPQDAWIGFMNNVQGKTTRTVARPFTIDEQKKILTVGACLTCHKENSKVMLESLKIFDILLKRVSSKCVLPKWD